MLCAYMTNFKCMIRQGTFIKTFDGQSDFFTTPLTSEIEQTVTFSK